MPDKCIRALITGRVQGVFFRDSTRQQARRFDIRGYAKNLPDGRVEVIACGDADNLDKLINWLYSGPEYSQVDNVTVHTINIDVPSGFYIR